MHCAELELLRRKYARAESKEDIFIKRLLDHIAEQFVVCEQAEYYYADLITRDFCHVIEMMEKKSEKERAEEEHRAQRVQSRFQGNMDLARAFYNHYKEDGQVDYLQIQQALNDGRKDLVNPTMKDYVARIYTFSGPKYLGQMFSLEQMEGMDPVLFTYENIELILATFKTRDERGQIIKQRVNIRSALRKLNEFKQLQQR